MADFSLAEAVLFSLAEDSGVMPDDDLLERVEKAPPGVRRRLGRLDPLVFGLCGTLPLEMSGHLAALVADGTGDDGRVDTEKAWDAVVAAREGAAPDAPDATADRLLEAAHRALGLDWPCQPCADWQPEDDEDEDEDDGDQDDADHAPSDDAGDDDDEGEDDPHDGPASLLERVFSVHDEALDTWPAQVAYRIAANAGDTLSDIAGFDVMHDVVGHTERVDGVSREQRYELHIVQHVGMNLCLDAAQVHALALAHAELADADGVTEPLAAAERVAAQETGVLGAVVASVMVDRLAPQVDDALTSAPPSGPPNRPARRRKPRR